MFKKILLLIAVFLGHVALFVFLFIIAHDELVGEQYMTTDISDYGDFMGTLEKFDGEKAEQFVFSFFPKKIDDSFSEVTYSYSAEERRAFAVYLEFVIEDKKAYDAFVLEYTSGIEKKCFAHDNTYEDYTIQEQVSLGGLDNNEDGIYQRSEVFYSISNFKKILCSPSEQRIIFVAIYADDTPASLEELDFGRYFDRFNIDPLKEYSAS